MKQNSILLQIIIIIIFNFIFFTFMPLNVGGGGNKIWSDSENGRSEICILSPTD